LRKNLPGILASKSPAIFGQTFDDGLEYSREKRWSIDQGKD
jgi:hypothetical protein